MKLFACLWFFVCQGDTHLDITSTKFLSTKDQPAASLFAKFCVIRSAWFSGIVWLNHLTKLFAWFCLSYLPASRPDTSISLLHVPWRTSQPAAAGSSKLSQKPQLLGFLQCFFFTFFSSFWFYCLFFIYEFKNSYLCL